MAPLPPEVVAAVVSQAFPPGKVREALAVSWCESSWDSDPAHPSIPADGHLHNAMGLFGIRWDDRQTGTGGPRDRTKLADPLHNATAAATISGGGSSWDLWSCKPNAANLAKADEALSALAANGGGINLGDVLTGGALGPLGGAAANVSNPVGGLVGLAQSFTDPASWIRAGKILGGVLLVVLGVWIMVRDLIEPYAVAALKAYL